MMCRPASFKANYGARLPRKEREHLPPREFSTHDRLFSRVDAMELETVLRRVHANTNNLIHGRPLSRVSTAPVCHNVAVRGRPPHQSVLRPKIRLGGEVMSHNTDSRCNALLGRPSP